MKLLALLLLAAPTLNLPRPTPPAPKTAACVVQTPRGPRACAPEVQRPNPCVVVVLKPDGTKRTLPCR